MIRSLLPFEAHTNPEGENDLPSTRTLIGFGLDDSTATRSDSVGLELRREISAGKSVSARFAALAE